MSKRKLSLHIRIPEYRNPRNDWRKRIHAIAEQKTLENNIKYKSSDKLQLIVRLYFNKDNIGFHDVDNRLKDIMDALQGRMGGKKGKSKYMNLIPNDNQVYKVTIEKSIAPKQSHNFGHVIVRKLLGS